MEFVAHPQPFSVFPGEKPLNISFEVIARVASVRPLVFEILDSNEDQLGVCGIMRIYSVDARLRNVLPQLRFRDLVKARLTCAEGGIQQTILTEVKKFPGEPVYFHDRHSGANCSKRSGVLAAYRKRNLEALTAYQDGSVSYSDGYGNTAVRQRIGGQELARLMRAFRDAGFNSLKSTVPPIDDAQARPSITLVCGRLQRVLVSGREAMLEPVLTAFEEVKAMALSNSYYRLSYQEKREITLLDWPFPQLPAAELESVKRAAQLAENEARQTKRTAHGPFEVIHQEVPVEFLAKLPAMAAMGADFPNRDVYVRTQSRIFRVNRTCTGDNPRCKNFESLSVQEVPDVDVLMTSMPANVVSDDQFYSSRLTMMIYGMLWPSDAGFALGDVSGQGRPLSKEEYAKHQPLYRELFTSGTSGLTFIEGRYFYKGVRISLEER